VIRFIKPITRRDYTSLQLFTGNAKLGKLKKKKIVSLIQMAKGKTIAFLFIMK